MVPSLSRSTSLKTLLMSFSGMGCPSTDWNLVQPAPFTASIMSCKQSALAAYWWAVDNSKYHELRQIQNSVTLGSVLPEKFTNIFVLEWYYVSIFWAVEDSHTAHLVQVTRHAVEEVQNLIDVHLPVCFSVDPLEHLLILILSSTFNLVGHTQNRRHNKYLDLEPFHCGGILRRKINNIWESKSHSSLNLDQMTNWMIPDWGDRCHLSLAWWQWVWCPPQYPLKTTQQIQTCLEHLSILHLNCLSVSNSSLQWAKLRQNHCYPVGTFWLSCYSWHSWYFVQLYK